MPETKEDDTWTVLGPIHPDARDDEKLIADGGTDHPALEEKDRTPFGRLYQRDPPVRCELCREREPELRPTCVDNREEIPVMCDTCYVDLRNAGRLDLERDAEVFGYANHV